MNYRVYNGQLDKLCGLNHATSDWGIIYVYPKNFTKLWRIRMQLKIFILIAKYILRCDMSHIVACISEMSYKVHFSLHEIEFNKMNDTHCFKKDISSFKIIT